MSSRPCWPPTAARPSWSSRSGACHWTISPPTGPGSRSTSKISPPTSPGVSAATPRRGGTSSCLPIRTWRPTPPKHWPPTGLQVGAEQSQVSRGEPVPGRLCLVPGGVDERRGAGLVQLLPLLLGKRQLGGRQVVRQLVSRAGADHQRGDRWLAEGVGQCDLGRRDTTLLRDPGKHLDRVVQGVAVVNRRLAPVGEVPRARRGLLAPAVLARQQAARERAPDQHPKALVDGERNELVFGLPGLQRVVDLLADEPGKAGPLADAQRLHQ